MKCGTAAAHDEGNNLRAASAVGSFCVREEIRSTSVYDLYVYVPYIVGWCIKSTFIKTYILYIAAANHSTSQHQPPVDTNVRRNRCCELEKRGERFSSRGFMRRCTSSVKKTKKNTENTARVLKQLMIALHLAYMCIFAGDVCVYVCVVCCVCVGCR